MNPSDPSAECAWALETLFESWDAKAEPGRTARLRRHLERCPDCRRAQDWDQRLTAALVATPFPAPPAALEAQIKERLRRRRRRRFVAALATAAAVVVGLAFALLLASGI
jgi:predicted anti-sigma-YlaC factor YlaD